MRRDYVTLHVRSTDNSDRRPTIVVEYDGPTDLLEERLTGPDGGSRDADDVDVAFRLTTAVDADDATGVFSLTDRVTGEFLLEANTDADLVLDLVTQSRKDDEPAEPSGCYCIELHENGEVWRYEKETLLVYDSEGRLLRQQSLIPSGVEL